jgi:ribose-phosphate pyrophosphokinase
MKIFSGSANKSLAEKIAHSMGESISPIDITIFADGERRIRLLEDVVDEDVVVVQPTTTPVDMNYMELFFIADALARSGARSIIAIIPYVGYQRQDHIFRDGEAVSLEVIAKTLQAVGVDRLITLDLHSIRIPQAFKIPVIHLSALSIFANVIKENNWNTDTTVLVSPDMGGIRRIKLLSEMLDDRGYAVVEKKRDLDTGSVEAVKIEGQLAKRAIIVDDMVTSGETLVKAAEALVQKGVKDIIVFATHGILVSGASKVLQNSPIQKVFVTDTVLVPQSKRFDKLEILSVAAMVGEELKIKN